MSNCTSYEILFFDTKTGKNLPSGASAFRNETWNTWTCTLGWPVQGIWPPFANGTDINSVDRSPDGIVLATADDFGKVKLFKYPNPVEKSGHQAYMGHSSHVTNVRFLKQGNYLISTGGEDKCIFQWKYFLDKESAQQSQAAANKTQNLSSIADDITEPPKLKGAKASGKPSAPVMMGGEEDGGMFQEEAVGDGD
jgi:microtubule-associated protein-like 6